MLVSFDEDGGSREATSASGKSKGLKGDSLAFVSDVMFVDGSRYE